MRPPDPSADPVLLAEALVAAQRWEPALVAIGNGLATAPQDTRLLALAIRALRALDRPAEALRASEQLAVLAPHDPYTWRLRTFVLVDLGQVQGALDAAGRAVALDPHNGMNHLALARAWSQSRRPDAVARHLAAAREAVLLEPGSVDAHLQIGTALADSGDVEAARAAYREVLRRDPGNSAALNNLAILDLQSGAHRVAARTLAAALAADPGDRGALHNLDVAAVWAVRRLAWLLLLGPMPALVAGALGWPGAARLLAGLVLLGVPLWAARWWTGLTAGQRARLRGLPTRLPPRRWAGWPLGAGLVGAAGLALALVIPTAIPAGAGRAWAAVALTVALLRALSASLRRSRQAELAGRWGRLRRRRG